MIIQAIACAVSYRIRGGMGNEWCRKLLGKPAEWEVPNNIICGIWGITVAATLTITWATPLVALVVGVTAKIGYLKQVAEYFGFPSGFDLTRKENVSWQNLSLLSARGALILLPAALCFCQLYPHLWYGVLAGACMPIWYYLGTLIPERKGVISHSQIGELLIGLSIGIALS